MNVKIDKADYAILYGVSSEQWPAWLLLKDETMGGVNRFWPGLAGRELTEHFFRLWSEGLIECAEGEGEPAIAPDYRLAREQFEFDNAVSDRPEGNPLTYRLSPQGGDVWAQYADVDWSKFFSSWCGSEAGEWTLNAAAREAIDMAVQIREVSPLPISGTECWEILQPWHATYWKVLPRGIRLRYRYEKWTPTNFQDELELTRWEQLQKDFAPYWSGWHKTFEEVCREHFSGHL